MISFIKYFCYSVSVKRVPELLVTQLIVENAYFRNLNLEAQKEFARRTFILSKSLRFKNKNKARITPEIINLISSALCQLTFGFKTFFLSQFITIIIAPRQYTLQGAPYAFTGHTDPHHGTITFSWPHLKMGYEIEDDSKNLALHELSHGLILQHTRSFGNLKRKNAYRRLKKTSRVYMNSIKNGDIVFIRKYGASNFMEFFACSVEAFFEQPEVFLKEQPKLYDMLSSILNQSPINYADPRHAG